MRGCFDVFFGASIHTALGKKNTHLQGLYKFLMASRALGLFGEIDDTYKMKNTPQTLEVNALAKLAKHRILASSARVIRSE